MIEHLTIRPTSPCRSYLPAAALESGALRARRSGPLPRPLQASAAADAAAAAL